MILQLTAAFVRLCGDSLKTACLFLLGRALFFPQTKKRFWLLIPLGCLLAGNAVFSAFALSLPEEDRRLLSDAAALLLSTVIPLAAAAQPRAAFGRLAATSLLLDFTMESLYSLVAPLFHDAPLAESAFSTVFFGAFLLVLHRTEQKQDVSLLRGALGAVPGWAWAVLFFFEFTCYYRTFGEAYAWYGVFAGVCVVSLMCCLFFLFSRIFAYANRQTQILSQLELQERYGEKLVRSDEELRQFRHDYNNHLIVIRAYLESGDSRAAKAYFDHISALSPEALRTVNTGSFAADALISYHRARAEAQGTAIRFFGRIPATAMREEDLCTVVSNLLSNALDATAALPGEKTVIVEAIEKNGSFLLSVSNPTAPGSVSAADPAGDGLPPTTKTDRKNHGLGLKNVKRTVQKYGGSFIVFCENNTFTAQARVGLR